MRKYVMARRATVQCSDDFHDTQGSAMPSVKSFHLTEAEIKEVVNKDQPWDEVADAKGISKIHSIILMGTKTTSVCSMSTS